ncbi:MAG TPA: pilus assembly protein PilM, partial [Patescibacteria group bacterium]|nr:pilus assembly protein PilM [Patescibacteria group bacterium]
LPLTEVKLDYEIISRSEDASTDKKMEVLLVAAPNVLINRYLKIIDMAGLKPHALETEITASSRSLITSSQFSPTTLLLEVGATTTELSVIASKKISFTRSIATGGLAFTRAVAQDLGFEVDQAEQYKRTYGLDGSQLEGKIAASIKPIFDVVTAEVRRTLAYWAGKRPEDNIKRIIVTGGSARMPGLIPYLTDATGLEAELGNPWEGLSWSPTIGQEFREEGPTFAIAVGLAQKEVLDGS